ncbi:hypothetical protein OH76DRAFT_1411792 [Lentinus brumalis]|uniref:Uncharacterized protein n=1 Tax=Lentinus brumalis TaxID=2498619 RepID=A0A371CNF2_9APHY|nr:hypothetical protein OH76DRAFT_1411792 [Polyporus brumalis]
MSLRAALAGSLLSHSSRLARISALLISPIPTLLSFVICHSPTSHRHRQARPEMQSYSNPDLFFCPLYNRPGMSDPKMNLCGSEEDTQLFGTTGSSAGSPSSSSPTSPCSSTNSSQTSSRSSSPSPSSGSERKLHKYKRMSAKAGKSLLDFATEVESRRIVHEKRKQLKASQMYRNAPGQS